MNFENIKKAIFPAPVVLLAILLFSTAPFEAFGWGTVSIDYNIAITPSDLSFETVFPEEVLFKPILVSLSSTFLSNLRFDDVEYHIEQWIKPRVSADSLYCKDNPTDYARCYPSLCPYLSKHADGTPNNDNSVPAFHDPTASTSIAYGRLAKSDEDLEDNWLIALVVPCFRGRCAQDNVVPRGYELNGNLEGQLFGCDLKFIVDRIS